MKKWSLNFFFILFTHLLIINLFAQKPSLTIQDLGKWPSVENPKISNDGKYAMYTYKEDGKESLVIKATEGSWEKWVADAASYNSVFTENSQFVITQKKDSILILNLLKREVEEIAGVSSYRTPTEGSGEWLAYQLNDKEKTLVVHDLFSGNENRFASVRDFVFNSWGTVLLLRTEAAKDSSTLWWHNLKECKTLRIWNGKTASNLCVDALGKSLAFIGTGSDIVSQRAIWYYKPGMDRAFELADINSEGVEKSLRIRADEVRFNKDASKVFFYLEPSEKPKPKPDYVSVDVWSYMDAKLQSQQLRQVSRPQKYLSVVNLRGSINGLQKVIRLENEGDEVIVPVEKLKGNYVLLQHRTGDGFEYNWNKASFISVYLLNTNNGTRNSLKDSIHFSTSYFKISPDEKFIINYDSWDKNYYSYEILTGIKRNVTKGVTVPLNLKDGDTPESFLFPQGFGVWLKGDKAFLIYDQYDIWQVDPLCGKKPECITRGYGRSRKIRFKLLNELEQPVAISKKNQRLILSSFNTITKENGFYSVSFDQKIELDSLYNGPFLMYSTDVQANFLKPIRAKNSDVYLISQQSISETLNYFTTKDFKNFNVVSNIQSPKVKYKWIKSELINWITFNGSECRGILYKPDDFDPTKKYPIILTFYESNSNKLNVFIKPELSDANLPIAYFTSNGYLVLNQDIVFKIGEPGKSIYNSVVSAAKYLSKFSWADSAKMGIIGHSFGGYEVNYLVTQTDVFAAAVSGAGVSDFISSYGSLRSADEIVRHHIYEVSQSRVGSTLWEKPSVYINNSPIFNADKVTTPLLLMNNKDDGQVPFAQGIEMITAMRRLGKEAWLLQYDNEEHGLDARKNQVDFTIRLKQYFDHYLKDAPAPAWETKGIPARLKGVITGYDLDPAGNCGKDCKVFKLWNEKMKKDSAGTMKEIYEKAKTDHWMIGEN
jgi:dipeptidyl aminopeptidase/acylaminoacyl peptidase